MGADLVVLGALFFAPPAWVCARLAEQPLSIAGFRHLGVAEALGGLAVLAPLVVTTAPPPRCAPSGRDPRLLTEQDDRKCGCRPSLTTWVISTQCR